MTLPPHYTPGTPHVTIFRPFYIFFFCLLLRKATLRQSQSLAFRLPPSSLSGSCMHLFLLMAACKHALQARCTARMIIRPVQRKYERPTRLAERDPANGIHRIQSRMAVLTKRPHRQCVKPLYLIFLVHQILFMPSLTVVFSLYTQHELKIMHIYFRQWSFLHLLGTSIDKSSKNWKYHIYSLGALSFQHSLQSFRDKQFITLRLDSLFSKANGNAGTEYSFLSLQVSNDMLEKEHFAKREAAFFATPAYLDLISISPTKIFNRALFPRLGYSKMHIVQR